MHTLARDAAIRPEIARILPGLAAVALTFGSWLPSAQAQPEAPDPALQSKKKNLILVVGVQPNPERRRMTEQTMKSVMRQALDNTDGDCRCSGEIGVTEISPVFYSEFRNLMNQTDKGTAEPEESEGEGVLMSPPTRGTETLPYLFKTTLKDKNKYLYKLDVEYEDKTTESYTPSNNPGSPVTKAGTDSQDRAQYWVRLKAFPEKYTITAKGIDQPDSTYSGAWPRTRSHYAVTFKDFEGPFERLRERLVARDDRQISEPIDEIAEFADNRFLLASIGFRINEQSGPNLRPDNLITITIPVRRGIAGVWIKLPYSEKDIDGEVAPWNTLADGEAVIAKLRQEPLDELMAAEPTDLTSASAPKWYRLQKDANDPTKFSRQFRLTDQPAFAARYSKLGIGIIHQTGEGQKAVASSIGKDWVRKQVLSDKDDADLGTAKPADAAPDKPAAPATETRTPAP